MNDNITYIIYLKVVSQTFYPVFCISTCKLSDLGILSNLGSGGRTSKCAANEDKT